MATTQEVVPGGAGASPNTAGYQLVARERPSYTPTIVVTLLAGLIGLWPAIRHSRMARERGYTSRGYWWAFWLCFLVPSVLAALLFVPGLSLLASVGSNPAPKPVQPTSSGSVSPLARGVVTLPAESQADTPAMAAKELTYDYVYAYSYYIADSAARQYLAAAYSCADSSCGYTQAAAQIGTARLITNHGPRIVVNQATSTSTGISATTTAYVIGAHVVLTFQAVWTGTHWGAISLALTGETT